MGLVSLPPAPGLSYKREVFLASSTFTLPATAQNKFDALLVAGGGGGARGGGGTSHFNAGGNGKFVYYGNVTCTNGTTLTITVGGGGTGATSNSNDGGSGTASTISGIVGNGATTSLTSGTATGGRYNAGSRSPGLAFLPSVFGMQWANSGSTEVSAGSAMFADAFAHATGQTSRYDTTGSQIGQGKNWLNQGSGNWNYATGQGGTNVPLAGSLLHATVGSSGQTVSGTGGASVADTFFAGGGGGSNVYNLNGYPGQGGGGGGGGGSSTATNAGAGGNASANSGGGGGGGGRNSNTAGNVGNGGNGGSGLVIIGYWG